MSIIYIFAMFVKAVILTLGVLAWLGHAWAFGLFLIVTIMAILVDVLAAIVVKAEENKKEKGKEK